MDSLLGIVLCIYGVIASTIFLIVYIIEVELDLPISGSQNDYEGVSHVKLKRLIEKIIDDVLHLPALIDQSGVPAHLEDKLPPFFDPKKYQELLATAVLNKIVDSYNYEKKFDSSEKAPAKDLDKNHNKFTAQKDQDRSSTSSFEPHSDSSLTDPINLNRSGLVSPSDSCSNLFADNVNHNIPDEDITLTDYLAQHRVPLPDLSVESESASEDFISVGTSNGGDGTWENNWLFKKRKPSNDSPAPIGMLVPAPREDVRALIGDKTTDEVSDLSEAGSDFDGDDMETNELDESLFPPCERVLNKHLIGGKSTVGIFDELLEQTSLVSTSSLQDNEPLYTETRNDFVLGDDGLNDIEEPNINLRSGNVPIRNEAVNSTITAQILQNSPPKSIFHPPPKVTFEESILAPPTGFSDLTSTYNEKPVKKTTEKCEVEVKHLDEILKSESPTNELSGAQIKTCTEQGLTTANNINQLTSESNLNKESNQKSPVIEAKGSTSEVDGNFESISDANKPHIASSETPSDAKMNNSCEEQKRLRRSTAIEFLAVVALGPVLALSTPEANQTIFTVADVISMPCQDDEQLTVVSEPILKEEELYLNLNENVDETTGTTVDIIETAQKSEIQIEKPVDISLANSRVESKVCYKENKLTEEDKLTEEEKLTEETTTVELIKSTAQNTSADLEISTNSTKEAYTPNIEAVVEEFEQDTNIKSTESDELVNCIEIIYEKNVAEAEISKNEMETFVLEETESSEETNIPNLYHNPNTNKASTAHVEEISEENPLTEEKCEIEAKSDTEEQKEIKNSEVFQGKFEVNQVGLEQCDVLQEKSSQEVAQNGSNLEKVTKSELEAPTLKENVTLNESLNLEIIRTTNDTILNIQISSDIRAENESKETSSIKQINQIAYQESAKKSNADEEEKIKVDAAGKYNTILETRNTVNQKQNLVVEQVYSLVITDRQESSAMNSENSNDKCIKTNVEEAAEQNMESEEKCKTVLEMPIAVEEISKPKNENKTIKESNIVELEIAKQEINTLEEAQESGLEGIEKSEVSNTITQNDVSSVARPFKSFTTVEANTDMKKDSINEENKFDNETLLIKDEKVSEENGALDNLKQGNKAVEAVLEDSNASSIKGINLRVKVESKKEDITTNIEVVPDEHLQANKDSEIDIKKTINEVIVENAEAPINENNLCPAKDTASNIQEDSFTHLEESNVTEIQLEMEEITNPVVVCTAISVSKLLTVRNEINKTDIVAENEENLVLGITSENPTASEESTSTQLNPQGIHDPQENKSKENGNPNNESMSVENYGTVESLKREIQNVGLEEHKIQDDLIAPIPAVQNASEISSKEEKETRTIADREIVSGENIASQNSSEIDINKPVNQETIALSEVETNIVTPTTVCSNVLEILLLKQEESLLSESDQTVIQNLILEDNVTITKSPIEPTQISASNVQETVAINEQTFSEEILSNNTDNDDNLEIKINILTELDSSTSAEINTASIEENTNIQKEGSTEATVIENTLEQVCVKTNTSMEEENVTKSKAVSCEAIDSSAVESIYETPVAEETQNVNEEESKEVTLISNPIESKSSNVNASIKNSTSLKEQNSEVIVAQIVTKDKKSGTEEKQLEERIEDATTTVINLLNILAEIKDTQSSNSTMEERKPTPTETVIGEKVNLSPQQKAKPEIEISLIKDSKYVADVKSEVSLSLDAQDVLVVNTEVPNDKSVAKKEEHCEDSQTVTANPIEKSITLEKPPEFVEIPEASSELEERAVIEVDNPEKEQTYHCLECPIRISEETTLRTILSGSALNANIVEDSIITSSEGTTTSEENNLEPAESKTIALTDTILSSIETKECNEANFIKERNKIQNGSPQIKEKTKSEDINMNVENIQPCEEAPIEEKQSAISAKITPLVVQNENSVMRLVDLSLNVLDDNATTNKSNEETAAKLADKALKKIHTTEESLQITISNSIEIEEKIATGKPPKHNKIIQNSSAVETEQNIANTAEKGPDNEASVATILEINVQTTSTPEVATAENITTNEVFEEGEATKEHLEPKTISPTEVDIHRTATVQVEAEKKVAAKETEEVLGKNQILLEEPNTDDKILVSEEAQIWKDPILKPRKCTSIESGPNINEPLHDSEQSIDINSVVKENEEDQSSQAEERVAANETEEVLDKNQVLLEGPNTDDKMLVLEEAQICEHLILESKKCSSIECGPNINEPLNNSEQSIAVNVAIEESEEYKSSQAEKKVAAYEAEEVLNNIQKEETSSESISITEEEKSAEEIFQTVVEKIFEAKNYVNANTSVESNTVSATEDNIIVQKGSAETITTHTKNILAEGTLTEEALKTEELIIEEIKPCFTNKINICSATIVEDNVDEEILVIEITKDHIEEESIDEEAIESHTETSVIKPKAILHDHWDTNLKEYKFKKTFNAEEEEASDENPTTATNSSILEESNECFDISPLEINSIATTETELNVQDRQYSKRNILPNLTAKDSIDEEKIERSIEESPIDTANPKSIKDLVVQANKSVGDSTTVGYKLEADATINAAQKEAEQCSVVVANLHKEKIEENMAIVSVDSTQIMSILESPDNEKTGIAEFKETDEIKTKNELVECKVIKRYSGTEIQNFVLDDSETHTEITEESKINGKVLKESEKITSTGENTEEAKINAEIPVEFEQIPLIDKNLHVQHFSSVQINKSDEVTETIETKVENYITGEGSTAEIENVAVEHDECTSADIDLQIQISFDESEKITSTGENTEEAKIIAEIPVEFEQIPLIDKNLHVQHFSSVQMNKSDEVTETIETKVENYITGEGSTAEIENVAVEHDECTSADIDLQIQISFDESEKITSTDENIKEAKINAEIPAEFDKITLIDENLHVQHFSSIQMNKSDEVTETIETKVENYITGEGSTAEIENVAVEHDECTSADIDLQIQISFDESEKITSTDENIKEAKINAEIPVEFDKITLIDENLHVQHFSSVQMNKSDEVTETIKTKVENYITGEGSTTEIKNVAVERDECTSAHKDFQIQISFDETKPNENDNVTELVKNSNVEEEITQKEIEYIAVDENVNYAASPLLEPKTKENTQATVENLVVEDTEMSTTDPMTITIKDISLTAENPTPCTKVNPHILDPSDIAEQNLNKANTTTDFVPNNPKMEGIARPVIDTPEILGNHCTESFSVVEVEKSDQAAVKYDPMTKDIIKEVSENSITESNSITTTNATAEVQVAFIVKVEKSNEAIATPEIKKVPEKGFSTETRPQQYIRNPVPEKNADFVEVEKIQALELNLTHEDYITLKIENIAVVERERSTEARKEEPTTMTSFYESTDVHDSSAIKEGLLDKNIVESLVEKGAENGFQSRLAKEIITSTENAEELIKNVKVYEFCAVEAQTFLDEVAKSEVQEVLKKTFVTEAEEKIEQTTKVAIVQPGATRNSDLKKYPDSGLLCNRSILLEEQADEETSEKENIKANISVNLIEHNSATEITKSKEDIFLTKVNILENISTKIEKEENTEKVIIKEDVLSNETCAKNLETSASTNGELLRPKASNNNKAIINETINIFASEKEPKKGLEDKYIKTNSVVDENAEIIEDLKEGFDFEEETSKEKGLTTEAIELSKGTAIMEPTKTACINFPTEVDIAEKVDETILNESLNSCAYFTIDLDQCIQEASSSGTRTSNNATDIEKEIKETLNSEASAKSTNEEPVVKACNTNELDPATESSTEIHTLRNSITSGNCNTQDAYIKKFETPTVDTVENDKSRKIADEEISYLGNSNVISLEDATITITPSPTEIITLVSVRPKLQMSFAINVESSNEVSVQNDSEDENILTDTILKTEFKDSPKVETTTFADAAIAGQAQHCVPEAISSLTDEEKCSKRDTTQNSCDIPAIKNIKSNSTESSSNVQEENSKITIEQHIQSDSKDITGEENRLNVTKSDRILSTNIDVEQSFAFEVKKLKEEPPANSVKMILKDELQNITAKESKASTEQNVRVNSHVFKSSLDDTDKPTEESTEESTDTDVCFIPLKEGRITIQNAEDPEVQSGKNFPQKDASGSETINVGEESGIKPDEPRKENICIVTHQTLETNSASEEDIEIQIETSIIPDESTIEAEKSAEGISKNGTDKHPENNSVSKRNPAVLESGTITTEPSNSTPSNGTTSSEDTSATNMAESNKEDISEVLPEKNCRSKETYKQEGTILQETQTTVKPLITEGNTVLPTEIVSQVEPKNSCVKGNATESISNSSAPITSLESSLPKTAEVSVTAKQENNTTNTEILLEGYPKLEDNDKIKLEPTGLEIAKMTVDNPEGEPNVNASEDASLGNHSVSKDDRFETQASVTNAEEIIMDTHTAQESFKTEIDQYTKETAVTIAKEIGKDSDISQECFQTEVPSCTSEAIEEEAKYSALRPDTSTLEDSNTAWKSSISEVTTSLEGEKSCDGHLATEPEKGPGEFLLAEENPKNEGKIKCKSEVEVEINYNIPPVSESKSEQPNESVVCNNREDSEKNISVTDESYIIVFQNIIQEESKATESFTKSNAMEKLGIHDVQKFFKENTVVEKEVVNKSKSTAAACICEQKICEDKPPKDNTTDTINSIVEINKVESNIPTTDPNMINSTDECFEIVTESFNNICDTQQNNEIIEQCADVASLESNTTDGSIGTVIDLCELQKPAQVEHEEGAQTHSSENIIKEENKSISLPTNNTNLASNNTQITNALNNITSNTDQSKTFKLILGEEDLEKPLKHLIPGSIAEREHKKWYNAVEMPNNPYAPEALIRRLSDGPEKPLDIPNISPVLEKASNEDKDTFLEPDRKEELTVGLEADKPDYKRYSRDYYINDSKHASGSRKYKSSRSLDTNSCQNADSDKELNTSPCCDDKKTDNFGDIFLAKPVRVEESDPILSKATKLEYLSTPERDFYLLPSEEAVNLRRSATPSDQNSTHTTDSLTASEDSDTIRIYDLNKQETRILKDETIKTLPDTPPVRPTVLSFTPKTPAPTRVVIPTSLRFLQPKRKLFDPKLVMTEDSPDKPFIIVDGDLVQSPTNGVPEKPAIEKEVASSLPSVKALAKAFLFASSKATAISLNKPKSSSWQSIDIKDETSNEGEQHHANTTDGPSSDSYSPPYEQRYCPISSPTIPEISETNINDEEENRNETSETESTLVTERSISPVVTPGQLRNSIAFFENLKKK